MDLNRRKKRKTKKDGVTVTENNSEGKESPRRMPWKCIDFHSFRQLVCVCVCVGMEEVCNKQAQLNWRKFKWTPSNSIRVFFCAATKYWCMHHADDDNDAAEEFYFLWIGNETMPQNSGITNILLENIFTQLDEIELNVYHRPSMVQKERWSARTHTQPLQIYYIEMDDSIKRTEKNPMQSLKWNFGERQKKQPTQLNTIEYKRRERSPCANQMNNRHEAWRSRLNSESLHRNKIMFISFFRQDDWLRCFFFFNCYSGELFIRFFCSRLVIVSRGTNFHTGTENAILQFWNFTVSTEYENDDFFYWLFRFKKMNVLTRWRKGKENDCKFLWKKYRCGWV